MGLIPDLAVMRDRAKTKIGNSSTACSRWAGPARTGTGAITKRPILILAGLSTPLVLSVHSIVSLDFAVSQLPGWHTTIFPPYFVAGAIFSGFGMVLTLLIPLRKMFKLEDIITMRHIDLMCKVTLATGSIVGYAYGMEFFIAWYSGNPYERFTFMNRAFGPYWWGLDHDDHLQRGRAATFLVQKSAPEPDRRVHPFDPGEHRHVVRAVRDHGRDRLHRDFLPSNWGYFKPTWVDICTYHRHVRFVLHVFPVVHAVPADDRHFGSQRRDAAG